MANASPAKGAQQVVRMSAFERLPWRRMILVALSIFIATFVIYGSWKTLTLPDGEAYSAAAWRDFIILGIAQGAILALIALGYTLVYGILRMINFAHGEVFMVGAFASYFFADAYVKSGYMNRHPISALGILFLTAIITSVGVGILLERVAYRPLRNSPRLVPLITAIGASLFLQNAVRGFFGTNTRGYPKPDILTGTWTIFGLEIAADPGGGVRGLRGRHDRAPALRIANQDGQVHARGRGGPRDRQPHGHRRRPRRRDHVRDRRRARRGGGGAVRAHVRTGELLHGRSGRGSPPSRPPSSAASAASAAPRSADSRSACCNPSARRCC